MFELLSIIGVIVFLLFIYVAKKESYSTAEKLSKLQELRKKGEE